VVRRGTTAVAAAAAVVVVGHVYLHSTVELDATVITHYWS